MHAPRVILALLVLLLAATFAGLAYPLAWVALRLRRQAARLRGEAWPVPEAPVAQPLPWVPGAGICRLVLDAHEHELRAGKARWH